MRSIAKYLALATCIGMLIVLLMGALVTKTNSGQGCGTDWPLCNGKFIPSYSIPTIIEYSHRFVTGLEGLLGVATFIAVFRSTRRFDARFYMVAATFFTILQAILGALAVVKPQSSGVLALHFGFSLLAFASTFLLSSLLWEIFPGRKKKALADSDHSEPKAVNADSESSFSDGPEAPLLPVWLRILIWVSMVYSYVVVYVGAYVKHTQSAAACSGWPLCNGQVIPELSGGTGIVFAHRLAAILLFFLIAVTFSVLLRAGAESRILKGMRNALVLVTLQVFSGAHVTLTMGTEGYLFASMMHTLIIAALFAMLCRVCSLALPERKRTNSKESRITAV